MALRSLTPGRCPPLALGAQDDPPKNRNNDKSKVKNPTQAKRRLPPHQANYRLDGDPGLN